MKTITFGSRGSQLAVAQTKWFIERIKKAHPNITVKHEIIKTSGDSDQTTSLTAMPGIGVFVKELRTALLAGKIDCAVHSLKDVPEEIPEGLALVSFPEREDARDILISDGTSFSKLPAGAKVGTGSPRRIMQLQAMRQDLEYISIRGNLDTRIQKVLDGEYDAVIAAAAGMKRLGRTQEITRYFSLDQMVPAIGQGALAVECRQGESDLITTLRTVNDNLTEAAILIEREFMGRVGGGCKVPMACHAYFSGELIRIAAIMGDIKQNMLVKIEKSILPESLTEALEELVNDLIEDCRKTNIPVPLDLPDNYLLS